MESLVSMGNEARNIVLKHRFTPVALQAVVGKKEYNSLDPHLVLSKTTFSISVLSRTITVSHLHLGLCLHGKRVGVKARTNKVKGDPLPHLPVLHIGFGN